MQITAVTPEPIEAVWERRAEAFFRGPPASRADGSWDRQIGKRSSRLYLPAGAFEQSCLSVKPVSPRERDDDKVGSDRD